MSCALRKVEMKEEREVGLKAEKCPSFFARIEKKLTYPICLT